MRLKMIVLLAALAVGLGCQSKKQDAAVELPDRNPALGYKLVQEGALLLDVRTPEEYQSRHIEGAQSLPVQELPNRLEEVQNLLGGDKQKPIVVHCKSGKRAAQAKEILIQNGFPNVTNLGGIDDWPQKN